MDTTWSTHAFGLLIGTGLFATLAGCSTAAPKPAIASPTVAFGAATSDVPSECGLQGAPRVLAKNVAPMAGVTATAQGQHVWLRYTTTRSPRVAEKLDLTSLDAIVDDETPPPEDTLPTGPVVVGRPDRQRLVAWTEGTLYRGLHVKAATLDASSGAVGEPIDLGYQGSAFGYPAAAVTRAGEGVLAFIESNGTGFQIVAMRVVCDRR
ncbi:MAG TPA: hypothetical protein VGL81_18830 [Polyangiaceae bacterium]|jgi:hypothetical protein